MVLAFCIHTQWNASYAAIIYSKILMYCCASITKYPTERVLVILLMMLTYCDISRFFGESKLQREKNNMQICSFFVLFKSNKTMSAVPTKPVVTYSTAEHQKYFQITRFGGSVHFTVCCRKRPYDANLVTRYRLASVFDNIQHALCICSNYRSGSSLCLQPTTICTVGEKN